MNGSKRVITNKPFSDDLFIDLIEKQKVSFIVGPPSQMALLVQNVRATKADLSSLKQYFVGGSAVPFTVLQKCRKLLPNCRIEVGYGMTEICNACSIGVPAGPNANGFLNENCSIKIIDDNGNNLGIGETGEIFIKTTYKWNGYYGNKEATNDTLDSEGWIKSGDLGYIDYEGNLFIVDRKKDILKYKNFHYFPTEIELVILELPDVVEVCVCGLPDLVMTDLPAAAIIKKAGSTLSENDVIGHVAKRMADFKHLRGGVYFVEELPKTASGKNVRKKVKELVIKLAGQ
uniref:AMP-dependent synthetase/ligase domain-containing protein n=1 Tax=Megaselia scalaris TaxID=36166 RepID=T1GC76_MEGSC